MIRIDGPKKPEVADILKLKKEGIPDAILQAYTAQGGFEGQTPVQVDGPKLVVEDKISIAEYQSLVAQATTSTRSVEIQDPSGLFGALGEGAVLRYLCKQTAPNFPDELILFYVSISSKYSREYYQRIKHNEFEFQRNKPDYVKELMSIANTNNLEHVSYKTKVYIGEYDFTKGCFTPDFFRELNRGFIQVAGVRYPVVVENQEQWFKELPLPENYAKQQLHFHPDRRVDAQWGFTIKEVSKEKGVVLQANSLDLLRDLNGYHPFWRYSMQYSGAFPESSHPEFPDNKYKELGDFQNPNNSPKNVRVFVDGDNQEIKVTTFHDKFTKDEMSFYVSLPEEQQRVYLARRNREKFYKMPFENGQARYVPCSKPEWVYLYRPEKAHKGFKFDPNKLNVAIVTIKKGFFKSSVETRMVYLDESQREIFENGSLDQISRL